MNPRMLNVLIAVMAISLILVGGVAYLQNQSLQQQAASINSIKQQLSRSSSDKEKNCTDSGGTFAGQTCTCPTDYQIEQNYCVNAEGTFGGMMGVQMRADLQQKMAQTATPRTDQEYDIFCQSMTKEHPFRKSADPLLSKAGWNSTSDQEEVCYNSFAVTSTNFEKVFVITSDCPELTLEGGVPTSPCHVAIIFVDLAAKKIQVIAKENTNPGDTTGPITILNWTTTSISYRYMRPPAIYQAEANYSCNNSDQAAQYYPMEEKTVSLDGSSTTVNKTCAFATCADVNLGLRTCTFH